MFISYYVCLKCRRRVVTNVVKTCDPTPLLYIFGNKICLNIGCIGTHATLPSSDIIDMLNERHHIMSHLIVFSNLWEIVFFKLKIVVFNGEQEKDSIIRVSVE